MLLSCLNPAIRHHKWRHASLTCPNLAIRHHPNARWVHKVDEDVLIGEGHFERISWDTAATDVDLHVWDEAGHHAWFRDPTGIPGGELSEDDRLT